MVCVLEGREWQVLQDNISRKDDKKSKAEVIPKTYSRKKELQNFMESSGENNNFDVLILFTIGILKLKTFLYSFVLKC